MDFPSNSKTPKQAQEKPKPEKIIEGTVIQQKKPFGRKFRDVFTSGVSAKSTAAYVGLEVVVPQIKELIAEVVNAAIDRQLFGDSRPGSRRSRFGGGASGRTDYVGQSTRLIKNGREALGQRRELSYQSRANHDFNEIVLATRFEAETVINQMFAEIEKYGVCKVSDLYEMLGITADFTDERWGWSDIRGAGVQRVRNGYLLDLPVPESLK